MNQFNISPDHHKWTIYLDNKALIQRIEGYITNIPISRWNIRADEDITKVAYSLLKKIPAQLTHVPKEPPRQQQGPTPSTIFGTTQHNSGRASDTSMSHHGSTRV
jgi:hypothetical protein